MRVGGESAEAIVARRPGKAWRSEGPKEERQSGVGSFRNDDNQWSETAGRDNCGHYPGLAKTRRPGETRRAAASGLHALT
jgi:hypothetical protein